MTQNEAKRKIQELVSKYEQVKLSGRIDKYSEQDTKDSFIRPMFEALGWDFDDREEVSKEEFVNSAGRVDYGIYLNNQPKLFIEAKKLGAAIHKPEFAEQAIRYCFNRVVTWAVLTDFESLKVFNAQNVSENLSNKLYFEIPYTQYVERFDQIWQLSKESFETGLIDKEAMKVGKLQQKITVTEQLAKDLNEIRELLTKSLHQWNEKVTADDLDEGVQKLLDRLIFLRVAEDRGIEEPILKQLVRDFDLRKDNNQHIYQSMITKFRELDEVYNSGLFSQHPFEKWEEYGGATKKAIDILYGKSGYYEYDFKLIPSDVLGQVYESYLGHLLSKSRKGLTLDVSAKKRKEQGIYYTPSYIEDYIVEQALKPVLDNCHSVAELKAIKVLDPACGSGSFLIKAMEMIEKKYVEFGARKGEGIRLQVLLDNIYGVDLDEKAVEIARLNLVINSLETRMKLPGLEQHIKNGNSLISGTDEELKKYFGKNFRDKKPFNWEEEFPEVFNRPSPGFDVIIGNPPWVTTRHSELGVDLVAYFKSRYKSAEGFKLNLFPMFVELFLLLSRKNGISSLIIPNRLLDTPSYAGIRKDIIDNMTIIDIQNLPKGAFDSVVAGNIIITIQKNNQAISNNDLIITDYFTKEQLKLSLSQIKSNDNYTININGKTIGSEIINKIKIVKTTPLSEICNVHVGMMIKDKNNKLLVDKSGERKIVVGRDFERYHVNKFRTFNFKDIEIFGGTKKPEKHEMSPKLFVRKTGNTIVSAIDRDNTYAEQSVYLVLPKTKIPIEYLEGILNSRLITYYFQNELITNPESYPYIQHYDLEKLPIVVTEKSEEKIIVEKVKAMHKLKKAILLEIENSNKWCELNKEIEKTNKLIDQLVYKLYGLTEEEIKIVEGGQ